MEFEWDQLKASANRRKHGVSFEEIASIFDDPQLIVAYDARHSKVEHRHLATGISNKGRLLTACVCRLENSIRIINGRKATAKETWHYGQSDA